MDIIANVDAFLQTREREDGNASFDYCYNHFRSFYPNNIQTIAQSNMELSCLHLGFYLASWGMYRGGAPISKKSIVIYEKVMNLISKLDWRSLWDIDINNYSDENIELLLKFRNKLREKEVLDLGSSIPSDTLVTKIMLGVFGNVPAFDRYFCKSFKSTTFTKHSLGKLATFYREKKDIIDNLYKRPTNKTLKLNENQKTFPYPRVKIVDMAFFWEGLKSENPNLDFHL